MALFKRLTVLAGAAEAARRYARKNPDKAGKYLDQAAAFVDKQTKGKYSNQIRGAATKAKGAAGIHDSGPTQGYEQNAGYGQHQGYGDATPPTQSAPPRPSRPSPPPNSPRL
jgi:hypothetical protein